MSKKEWEIWSEGFKIGRVKNKAIKHGEAEGSLFEHAVGNLAKKDETFRTHLDFDKMTFWGCKLFATEKEARKTFG